MRSEHPLCLALALASAALCSAPAQQTMPSAPPATAPSQPATEPPQGTADEVASKHALRTLPPDVAPNPPKPEDLTSSGMSWKGEYEADAIGLPLLGPDGQPLPVLYNRKGKRVKSRIKIPETHPINITAGTLTVDGWTGKAHLNYVIPDLRFIYLSVPITGTLLVAQTAFPGAKEQKAAFSGNTLTVTVDDHRIELASEKPLLGKRPSSAWVRVDPDFRENPRYPVMGYGSSAKAPYEWPGAKQDKNLGALNAPLLPRTLMPKLEGTCFQKGPCGPPPKPVAISGSTTPKQ